MLFLCARRESLHSKVDLTPSYYGDQEKGLEGFQVKLEGSFHRFCRNCIARFASSQRSVRRTVDRVEFHDLFCDIALIFAIFVLPNLIAAGMAFVYVYASVNPLSSVNAALHFSQGSYFCYEIAFPLFAIAAGFVNLVALVGGIKVVSRHAILIFLACVVASAPVWVPYVVEAALRKHLWNVECEGFDMTIYLDAVKYGEEGLSSVTFPASIMGGIIWQVYQSGDGIWSFGPENQNPQVTLFIANETYTFHDGTEGTLIEQPLSFPELGLHSDGKWIRSCYPPAVLLQNATDGDVVKTGLSAYTNCARQQVCVNTNMGMEAIVVSIGRILIALQEAASCCTRSRWS